MKSHNLSNRHEDEQKQADAFYSASPQNREHGQNVGYNCKTIFEPSCIHFVRFPSLSDQRFQNAARAFGPPDFLHRHWDNRAQREIACGDLVVFAKGDADQPIVPFNGNDEVYA